jgi:hypothetical protein
MIRWLCRRAHGSGYRLSLQPFEQSGVPEAPDFPNPAGRDAVRLSQSLNYLWGYAQQSSGFVEIEHLAGGDGLCRGQGRNEPQCTRRQTGDYARGPVAGNGGHIVTILRS